MKISKYFPYCLCFVTVCSEMGICAFNAEDPSVAEVKERVRKLEEDDQLAERELAETKTRTDEIKAQSETITTQLKDLDQKVTEGEQKLESLATLEESFKSLEAEIQACKTELEELRSKTPPQNQVEELQAFKEQQQEENTKQNAELARLQINLENLESQTSAESGSSGLLNLAGSVIQGGMGLLAKKLDLDAIKSSATTGQPIPNEGELSPTEMQRVNSIKASIFSGKSDEELQIEVNGLNREIAQRQAPTFYGVNETYKSDLPLIYIKTLAKDGKNLESNWSEFCNFFKTPPSDIDKEIANIFYEAAKRNPNITLQDMRTLVNLVFFGEPKKEMPLNPQIMQPIPESQTQPAQISQANQLQPTQQILLGQTSQNLQTPQSPPLPIQPMQLRQDIQTNQPIQPIQPTQMSQIMPLTPNQQVQVGQIVQSSVGQGQSETLQNSPMNKSLPIQSIQSAPPAQLVQSVQPGQTLQNPQVKQSIPSQQAQLGQIPQVNQLQPAQQTLSIQTPQNLQAPQSPSVLAQPAQLRQGVQTSQQPIQPAPSAQIPQSSKIMLPTSNQQVQSETLQNSQISQSQQIVPDMTVQDIRDGAKYDVVKNEFIKIAKLSNKQL
ncbi:MAG: hypothetical protein LBU35_02015 [Holosporales bacterium]|nr:hypothetical protein [Holosporales bacterium]